MFRSRVAKPCIRRTQHIAELLLLLFLIPLYGLSQTTYTTVQNGLWSDPATWGGVYPSSFFAPPPAGLNWFTTGFGDILIIRHQVILDYNLFVRDSDLVYIDTTGVLLSQSATPNSSSVYNVSSGQNNTGLTDHVGISVLGEMDVTYLRNSWDIHVGPTGKLTCSPLPLDNFGTVSNFGQIDVVAADLNNNAGSFTNHPFARISVTNGNFNNIGTFLPDTNSCTYADSAFVNLAGATVSGTGFVEATDFIDNSINPLTSWTGTYWCSPVALNIPMGLQDCLHPGCPPVIILYCIPTPSVTQVADTFTFSHNSAGNHSSIRWDFGDGTSSTSGTSTHTYASPGTYTYCLSLLDSSGAVCDSICNTLTYSYPTCTAGFNYTLNGPVASFVDASTGTILNRFWEFGDGTTSNLVNPTHAYALPDTYQVCLRLFIPQGLPCDSICQTVIIPPDTCTANFTTTVQNADATFTNGSSGAYINQIWTFGDGSSSVLPNPTHTYALRDTYQVCLTLFTAQGMTCDSLCQTVIIPPDTCTANFTTTLQSTDATFTNASSGAYVNQTWTFGDGNTSVLSNPTHTYALRDTYQVCLTLFTAQGTACDSICQTVIIPPDTCTANFITALQDAEATFTNSSSGAYVNQTWTFGDGSSSVLPNPIHTYALPDTYQVCLTLITAQGITCDSLCQTVIIPPGACSANFTSSVQDSVVTFTNSSTGSISGQLWTFGDGNSDTAFSPTHNYGTSASGAYLACLNLYDHFGLVCDSLCDSVTIVNIGTGMPNPSQTSYRVYPNPFTEQFTLEVTLSSPGIIYWEIWDITGKMIRKSEPFQVKQGRNTVNWAPSGSFVAGIYGIRIHYSAPQTAQIHTHCIRIIKEK